MSQERRTRADRRKSSREPLLIPLDYSSVDAFFSEFASDINEGGMFIETDDPAELDELVQLQVRFPGLEEPVAVAGRVAWISDGKESPQGMGIEFQGLSNEARSAINSVVSRLRTS